MHGIIGLSKEDRRTVFRNTALKMGVHESIVEKDYWVCMALDYVFQKSRYRKHLTFKGGTSLSKCFGLIMRFSEDIDLVLDWRLLGYGKDEPWKERSKTKQDAFNKEINSKTEDFLADIFLPVFISDFCKVIGEDVTAVIEKHNPQTIDIRYPQLFSAEFLIPSIRLEIGALADWTPTVVRTITPYIFEHYPEVFSNLSTSVVTSSAERTFWEKVTILHQEANRPEHLDMPIRYSRHYYDLFCMARTEHKTLALNQLDLLDKVAAFKTKFYPRAWAKYEEAVPGSIRLVPPKFRLEGLRIDYESMKEMLFGEYPSFDSLISSIEGLECEINKMS